MATLNQYNVNNTNGQLFFSLVENPVVEPLDGPLFVEQLMARFPEETYAKGRDTHLYKFMTALVGDSGAGILKKKSLIARLQYESAALGFQDLDNLYSPMVGFDRLPGERYSIDPKSSTLTDEEWEAIKAADTAYRKRALGYLQAARQGGTLRGITDAAAAAIGRKTEVVENYRHIFDYLSDDPLNVRQVGRTRSVNEFIIRPHVSANDINQDEFARLVFDPDAIGDFQFVLNNEYSDQVFIDNISQSYIESVLLGLDSLEIGDVEVVRSTATAYIIRILKPSVSVQRLTVVSPNLNKTQLRIEQSAANELFYFANVGDPSAEYYDALLTNSSVEGLQERPLAEAGWAPSYLNPYIQKNLDTLVGKLKPVSSLFSISPASERYISVGVNGVVASSERFVVSRFVRYNQTSTVQTNKLDNRFLEVGEESEERNYAFTGYDMPVVFATIDTVISYTDSALSDPLYNTDAFYSGESPAYRLYESNHVGTFFDPVPLLPGYSFMKNVNVDTIFTASNILPANNTQAVFKGAVTV